MAQHDLTSCHAVSSAHPPNPGLVAVYPAEDAGTSTLSDATEEQKLLTVLGVQSWHSMT